MSYNVIIIQEAELDIQDTFEWYESQSSGLGSEFVRAVDTCLSGIGRNQECLPSNKETSEKSINSTISVYDFIYF